MFCAGNTGEEVNINEDIINVKDYMDNDIARDNNLAIDHENANVKPQNHEKNAEKTF